jgi:cytochrome c-type biogenesis protein
VTALAQSGLEAALLAFVAGILSFFSPCVAPLVPGYVGYLCGAALRADGDAAGSARAGTRQEGGRLATLRHNPALQPSLLFVAGFSAAFIALGLISTSFGRLIAAYRPVLETLAGIVMIVMGAFLLNLLPRGLTALLLRERRAHISVEPGAGRGLAAFGLGVVFAAGWTPCIGPVLASILVYASASADRGAGAALLAFYSLGFALPFLAVGLGWSASLRALGWLRRHGQVVSTVTGVALLVVGVVYLAGQSTIFAQLAQQMALPGPR